MPVGRAAVIDEGAAGALEAGAAGAGAAEAGAGAAGAGMDGGVGSSGGGLVVGSVMWLDASLVWTGSVASRRPRATPS